MTYPPGPKGHFLIGNLPEFGEDIIGFFTRCAKEYGDFVPLKLGGRKAFFLNHPDLIEAVLVTHNKNFVKHSFFWRNVRKLFGRGLLTSEGEFWLRQRRMAQPAFHKERIAGYGSIMVDFTEKMLHSWSAGQVVDIHSELMHVTSQIVARALFDSDLAIDSREAESAFSMMIEEIAARFRRPIFIPDAIPLPGNVRYNKAVRRLDRLVYKMIQEKRANPGEDLLSLMLQMRDEDGSAMSDQQLRDEAITLFLAGHETTAIALTWTLYLLSEHPEKQQLLIREVADVLQGRVPALSDLPQLKYTEMVIQESMRLYPPAYAFGREALHDCTINGHTIPAGATIFVSQWVMHRDARYFENPDQFQPERWADGFAKRLPRFAYFPFGGGPRLCIGNTFAMMEAVLMLATISGRFRLRTAPDHKVVLFPSITLRPKYGMRMIVDAC